ncbi:MAG: PolC-type DNA polymerase III, partial [Anaerolineae bacterium]
MNRTYVALDLETTGLDADRDTILEVGAVRFRTSFSNGTVQAQVQETWSSTVNPGRPIPIQVQHLTGITQEEVSRAPRFSQVLEPLRSFLGSHPLIGHNVSFDLSFLDKHYLPLDNLAVDTFEMA